MQHIAKKANEDGSTELKAALQRQPMRRTRTGAFPCWSAHFVNHQPFLTSARAKMAEKAYWKPPPRISGLYQRHYAPYHSTPIKFWTRHLRTLNLEFDFKGHGGRWTTIPIFELLYQKPTSSWGLTCKKRWRGNYGMGKYCQSCSKTRRQQMSA